MATTYNNFNAANQPITATYIDTGCATAPADRTSTFTPSGGYVAPTSVGVTSFGATGNDWSMNTTPGVRAMCFEAPSYTATIDLGLATNG